ncbi:hypothetical protein D9M68_807930 [compost metagenome]
MPTVCGRAIWPPALRTWLPVALPPETPLPVTVSPRRLMVVTAMSCAVVCTAWLADAMAGSAITVVGACGVVGYGTTWVSLLPPVF